LSIHLEIYRIIPTLQILFGSYCSGTAGILGCHIATPLERWKHVCDLLDSVF